MKNKHLQMIENAWNDYHGYYMDVILKKRPDFFEFFSNGGVEPDFEFSLLKVKNLKLLDVCCACDARQAFSWANKGAVVTACDISSKAVEIARENAAKVGLSIDFKVADAQKLECIPDMSHDIVYATYLIWYEDIKEACKNWNRVLKSEGRLLVVVRHPVIQCLEVEEQYLKVVWDYHNRESEYYIWNGTPAAKNAGYTSQIETVNFHHTISDIVNAIISSGFIIERMEESKETDSDNTIMQKLPMDLAIIAKKI